MGILQIILIIIAALAVVFVILTMMAPKEMKVEKRINLAANKEQVFPYILSFVKRNDWSPWAEMDPEMTTAMEGEDGQLGTVWRWQGNKNVGIGEQENTNIVTNELVETQVRFKEPFQSIADTYLKLEDASEGTDVIWGFSSKLPVPMNIIGLFMNLSDGIGKDYQKGLNKLKALVESQV